MVTWLAWSDLGRLVTEAKVRAGTWILLRINLLSLRFPGEWIFIQKFQILLFDYYIIIF